MIIFTLMRGTIFIRIKAALLSVIFTANFVVVCHCSAADDRSAVSSAMRGHCCCSRKAPPCKDTNRCPGTQAVKFNLLEKKAAATVHVRPAGLIAVAREFDVSPVDGSVVRHIVSSFDLPPHAPPDRLALYHCYLI